jgi:hypothetical protein
VELLMHFDRGGIVTVVPRHEIEEVEAEGMSGTIGKQLREVL